MKSLYWFREDLRLHDNPGLLKALSESESVAPIFIFNKNYFTSPKESTKINYLWKAVNSLKEELRSIGSDLIVSYGDPTDILTSFVNKFSVNKVYYTKAVNNPDLDDLFFLKNIATITLEEFDNTFILPNHFYDVLPLDKGFFNFSLSWRSVFKPYFVREAKSIKLIDKFAKFNCNDLISLKKLGIDKTHIPEKIGFNTLAAKKLLTDFLTKKLKNYSDFKDYPNLNHFSFLSIHLSFGTISFQEIIRETLSFVKNNPSLEKQSNIWLDNLIKRDYAKILLKKFPDNLNNPHNINYSNFPWTTDTTLFNKWCSGQTGYPLVDAAMNQLNKHGYIHHRLRLIVSSFLVKTLGIDYRLGEQYFKCKLLDYDLASNNYNWQYIASVGPDSLPYFKVLNPIIQSIRFDKTGKYIKKYIPVLKELPSEILHEPFNYPDVLINYGVALNVNYPSPIVDHEVAKEFNIRLHKEFLE